MNKPSKPPTPPTAAPCERTHKDHSGRLRGGEVAVATVAPNVPPTGTSASVDLLKLIGHHESCARLQRERSISSCDCRRGPMDDPSIAIGLVMHYARISLAKRVAIPAVIIELLTRHVDRGDLACRMVVEWLDTSGLIDLKPSPRSKRRPS